MTILKIFLRTLTLGGNQGILLIIQAGFSTI
ncbi:hypothetical protein ERAN111884_00485 [Erysipelothrix anatis]